MVRVESSSSFPVHNITTGLDYQTIQAAIDAGETSDGDTIVVDEGVYIEHVFINKSLNMVGRNRNTTIIDSGGSFRCFTVTARRVNITGFTARRARWAFYLYGSNESCIYGNRIEASDIGVHLEKANNNTVFGNIIANINFEGNAIYLGQASGNRIKRNIITNSSYGIYLILAKENTIYENAITNGSYAFTVELSSNNSFYHNNVRLFSVNVLVEGYSANRWDYGYPSGGNYWSDYNGTDSNSGQYQNETGSDGIGDTSYDINANNKDRYPLMNPYVALPADLNEDGKVDGKDIAIVAQAFASQLSHRRWNWRADLNHDNRIDGMDIVIVAKGLRA
jgi:parallel beta-helix repeat protein